MMYKKNFTAAIKVNGKILREQDDTVALPFGSEYSILLKNLNSVKAQVKVSVDGEDATEGTWLILQPNSSLDLERFIKNANYNKGNRFKFIERTTAIENNRGIKSDDGLVRVEYKFEKIYKDPSVVYHKYEYPWWYVPTPVPYVPYEPYKPWITCGNSIYCNSNDPVVYGTAQCMNTQATTTSGSFGAVTSSTSFDGETIKCSSTKTDRQNNNISGQSMTRHMNMCRSVEGITVPGSESHQSFASTYDFTCEPSEVMVIRLIGQCGNEVVQKPITVDVRPRCTICGKTNKATSKFCSECGTSLILF